MRAYHHAELTAGQRLAWNGEGYGNGDGKRDTVTARVAGSGSGLPTLSRTRWLGMKKARESEKGR